MGTPACAVRSVLLNQGSKMVAFRALQALPVGRAHQATVVGNTNYRYWFREFRPITNTAGEALNCFDQEGFEPLFKSA